jgi:hypothetical protein
MAQKSIIIESIQTPNQPGYLDKIVILDEGGILYHGPCSCCPNPYRPSDNTPWQKAYAWIACGVVEWQCWESPKHGKCLLLNNGKKVITRFPNINQSAWYFATEVEIHMGYAKDWRGSAGCITYPPDIADMIDFFEIGEKGKLEIIDYSNMRKGAVA